VVILIVGVVLLFLFVGWRFRALTGADDPEDHKPRFIDFT